MERTSRTTIGVFFALAFGISWTCWLAAALSGQSEPANLPTILHYIGGIGPLIATIVLTVREGKDALRDAWRRLVGVRRIGGRWYAVILGLVPILMALAVLLDLVLEGSEQAGGSRFVGTFPSLIPMAIFLFFFGPVPEEIAWRGYALDRLQERTSALWASLLLGIIWTIWHLPLFLIKGTYQEGLIGTVSFWLFLADKIPQTVVMTWIYNNNERSTLSAVLLHFMVNYVGELVLTSARAEVLYTILWWIVAVGVVALWGLAKLQHTSISASQREAVE